MLRQSSAIVCILICGSLSALANPLVDEIRFGDTQSEESHGLKVDSGEIIDGALGTSARQLLPPQKEHWRGGRMTFRMQVDPDKPNYFTVKFWGSDTTGEHSRLMLFLEGKQIGQRHLGEVDSLDISEDRARFLGRFFYKTLPLPEHMTRGQTSLELAIEAQGPVWGYGYNFEKFQQPMTKPSRGIYRAYLHTDPYLEPGTDETQGDPVIDFPIRREPGEEVLQEVQDRVNHTIDKMLKSANAEPIEGVRFLAYACFVPWSKAYRNKAALNKIVRSIDDYAQKFEEKPEIVEEEWFGAGPIADAVRLLAKPVQIYLDHKIEGTETVRRQAWAKLFAHSRDWHVKNRRSYTNQTMIVDLGIYRCNRALAVVDPSSAWPEDRAIRILHEAVGIEPWSGSLDERGRSSWRLGRRFMQLTEKGLTKELGYVGSYGEIVAGIVQAMYESSRPTPTADGDPKLKAQLVKMARARTVFRYPAADDDGYQSMRVETIVGWRDWHYPGPIAYGPMPTDDGDPLDVAIATGDPYLIGCCQQMIEDNQYFVALQQLNQRRGFNVLTSLSRAPGNYERITNYPQQPGRLPMSRGRPDFVYADPEIGVLAVKHGDDILYASLYWRARYAINFLARVHQLSPAIERDATVNIGTMFTDSGLFYKVPDQTNEPFNKRYEKSYKDAGMHLGMAGQLQPIARVPSIFQDYKPGDENIHAGMGEFYVMYYGPYCVAMNCSQSRTFTLDLPAPFRGSKNLVDHEIEQGPKRQVKPGETVVLYRER
ncbi:hypothetical protein [Aporhodopirellula aestuarii]|uniref:Secreted protein n=1 Tax=Aporhodopirellula aestuarii TaxID=2950107 RepID=A0ABT0UGU7_9BACT|nr:hypothetical protein [Aporhodopirellula aestuarii]MCM2375191.1 hypothetical protein [Aporhodopirellula aestuarii]